MSEPILKALIQLFALISDVQTVPEFPSGERDIVRLFLAHHLNNEMVIKYMEMFEDICRGTYPRTILTGEVSGTENGHRLRP